MLASISSSRGLFRYLYQSSTFFYYIFYFYKRSALSLFRRPRPCRAGGEESITTSWIDRRQVRAKYLNVNRKCIYVNLLSGEELRDEDLVLYARDICFLVVLLYNTPAAALPRCRPRTTAYVVL